MRISRVMLCAALSVASVSFASSVEDLAARLRHARSLRCTYHSAVGNWVRRGRQTVEQDPDNGTATYDDIDIAKGTARIIANMGATDLKAWIDGQGSLWLIEITPLGYEVVTTVFPMYAEGTNEFVVLESRNSFTGSIALGSNAYGTCKVWQ